MSSRLPLLLLVGGVALFLGGTQLLGDFPGGGVDYTEYGAAALLLDRGDNPYDARLLLAEQTPRGWPQDKAQMMWNPPWVFPIVLPLSWVPWKYGYAVWILLQVFAVRWAAAKLWGLYELPEGYESWSKFPALLFAPTIFLLLLGQSSGFLLAGIVGFTAGVKEKKPCLAGVSLALLGFKPHLFFTLLPLFAYDVFAERTVRRAVFVGLGTLALAAFFPMMWRVSIWVDYVAATQAPGDEFHLAPNQWDPPIFAGRLSAFFGDDLRVQFAPSLAVGLILLIIRIRLGSNWNWTDAMPKVMLASLLATGYGAWGFDLVLLLVPLFAAAGKLVGVSLRTWLYLAAAAVCANVLLMLGKVPVLWWSPLAGAAYLGASVASNQLGLAGRRGIRAQSDS